MEGMKEGPMDGRMRRQQGLKRGSKGIEK